MVRSNDLSSLVGLQLQLLGLKNVIAVVVYGRPLTRAFSKVLRGKLEVEGWQLEVAHTLAGSAKVV